MPREIIHWCAVDEVMELLDKQAQPKLAACLAKHKNYVYLGAVAHDAPYFANRGHHPFGYVAEHLHGFDGNDTLDPLRVILLHALAESSHEHLEETVAFVVGMISHVAIDAAFHPMVYYFTGNYNDIDTTKRTPARTRHRLLEVYLDAWFAHEVGLDATLPQNVESLLKKCRGSLDTICRHLGAAIEFENAAALWKSSLKEMAALQRLFLSESAGAAMRTASAVSGERLRGIDSLFSFGRRKPEALFAQPLEFVNPYSGVEDRKQVVQLYQEGITDCIGLIAGFESLLEGKLARLPEHFQHAKGKSLNLGIVGAKVQEARFFSRTGLPLPGLKISE